MPRRKPTGPRDRRGAPRPQRPSLPDPARDAEAQERRRAVCASKDRYATEAEARSFAIMHQPGAGPRAQTYHCEVCGGWHHTRGR